MKKVSYNSLYIMKDKLVLSCAKIRSPSLFTLLVLVNLNSASQQSVRWGMAELGNTCISQGLLAWALYEALWSKY